MMNLFPTEGNNRNNEFRIRADKRSSTIKTFKLSDEAS